MYGQWQKLEYKQRMRLMNIFGPEFVKIIDDLNEDISIVDAIMYKVPQESTIKTRNVAKLIVLGLNANEANNVEKIGTVEPEKQVSFKYYRTDKDVLHLHFGTFASAKQIADRAILLEGMLAEISKDPKCSLVSIEIETW